MEWFASLVDVVLHLDRHLALLVAEHGVWIYAILFAVIFAETGLVVAPFLPGDSMLFVAGSIAALGSIDVHLLVVALTIAAVLGNLVNYEIGRWCGAKLGAQRSSAWLRPNYLDKTHLFFETWGPVAVILARFVPFLRTYVPFVVGIGVMQRPKYVTYTVLGAGLWVGSLCYLGYFFGNLPWIKSNLGLLVVGIVIVSLLPVLVGVTRAYLTRNKLR